MITEYMYLFTRYEAPQWQKVKGSHATLTEIHTNNIILGYGNK